MTLVLNEFYLYECLNKTVLIAAADRRITMPDGTIRSPRKKLFKIPYLKGAVSYFGLAAVYPGVETYLSDWLPNFIRHQSAVLSLRSFAENLRNELNQIVPASVLQTKGSGFHICGYDRRGFPDFWYLSNIGKKRGRRYLRSQYAHPRSDFLGRDAKKLGWDGNDPLSVKSNKALVYRNGDF